MTVTMLLSVGVDIAAKTFVAAWRPMSSSTPQVVTFAQTPDGFAAFQQRLAATHIAPTHTQIALEATGSYWVALAVTLHQAGYHISVLNPGHVARYAGSLPRRGKTDAWDAQVLLQLATERPLPPWTPPPPVYHELRQRLVVRDSLLDMRTQVRNQRHALTQWPIQIASALTALDTIIADLDTQIATLEREVAQVLAHDAWAASATLLASIPGIGLVTTAWLLVGTLNFSLAASPEQLTSYIGLAPLPRESGTSVRGRRRIGHGGNGRLRTALYMATLTAARHNPTIAVFYCRLRAAGKPMKVARCAAARKLVHLAWAIVRSGQPYVAPGATPTCKRLTAA